MDTTGQGRLDEEAEDLLLAEEEGFIELRRRARADHRAGRSIPLEQIPEPRQARGADRQ